MDESSRVLVPVIAARMCLLAIVRTEWSETTHGISPSINRRIDVKRCFPSMQRLLSSPPSSSWVTPVITRREWLNDTSEAFLRTKNEGRYIKVALLQENYYRAPEVPCGQCGRTKMESMTLICLITGQTTSR